MNPLPTITKSRLLSGTSWIALAEALMLPTGFLTVVFLTHQLGPEGYGLFTLAATLVAWVEWGINSIFSRTTVKFVGEATDWQPIATAILQMQFGCSVLASLILVVLAPAIAALLQEPDLTPLLRLFAVEIPLFNLVLAHQNILTGRGQFGPRAATSATRWITRFLLIVVLVKMGLSVPGAVLGSSAAMLMSLFVCRWYVRPSLWQRTQVSARKLADYAVPLFLSALAIRFNEKLDLIMLKGLGSTVEAAGIYAVAQNLALLGAVVGPALASVLLATISRLLHQGQIQSVKDLSRTAMRVVLLHLPFAGLVWGSATEIVQTLFGPRFVPAAPIFSILIFASVAAVMLTVTSTILIASEKPRWVLMLTAPLPAIAVFGHGLLIPKWEAMGAASITLLVTWVGAIAGIVAVYVRWRVLPPGPTLGRTAFTSGLVALVANYWHTTGFLLLPKLLILSLAILPILFLLGEFNSGDQAVLKLILFKKFQRKTDRESGQEGDTSSH